MPVRRYVVSGLTLSEGPGTSPRVQDLQRDLRSLGYTMGPLDGVFGVHTVNAVQALQFDLMHNDGSSSSSDGDAPVAVRDYNKGSVTALTGALDQDLAACIVAMLDDAAFPKLPFSASPVVDNASAIAAVQSLSFCPVPVPFLMAILAQESDCRHFQVPNGANVDSFVTIGLDRNNPADAAAITSRGYGIGQFTLFHHPPTPEEVAGVILDPVKNVTRATTELHDKFGHYVAGTTPGTRADDRVAEAGFGPLRPCIYPSVDSRYMKGCAACLAAAGSANIVAGTTPLFSGAGQTYEKTQYHKGSYQAVPIRDAILCDWPYAVRRYNGSGVNSYDYQAEVLLRVVRRPI